VPQVPQVPDDNGSVFGDLMRRFKGAAPTALRAADSYLKTGAVGTRQSWPRPAPP